MDSIGKRIILLRDEMNISQVELARAIVVTKSTMSKYENNISIPNAEIIGKMADFLNTTTDFLIGRTKDKSPLVKGDNWFCLSEEEEMVLTSYRTLSSKNKGRINERIYILKTEQHR